MSYEEFFHLKDAPFRLTPDPDYFFPSGVHKEALDTMVFSINAGEGFVLITGTPGVGKTLLVRTLLRQLGNKVSLALVLNPTLSPRELLSVVLDDLGIFDMDEREKIPKEKLIRMFRDHLLEKAALGIRTIVIIDEAQNLPRDTMEELRMLSNLESDKEKLLQIILVGQPELEEMLRYDDMKQLAQRITIRYRLQPLSAEETGGYVRHRLEVAGDSMSVKFMPRVMGRIHSLSKGIPRRINLICERALMAAYVDSEKNVSRKHLVRAIKSIEGHEDRISTVPAWLWPALGAGLFLLALVVFGLSYNPSPDKRNVVETSNVEQVAPVAGTDLKSVPSPNAEFEQIVPNSKLNTQNSTFSVPVPNSKLNTQNSKLSVSVPVSSFLAVDRDKNMARLWQSTPAGTPAVKHEFQLDWRIMEGLYILGNDKDKGAFIFNPILFQWGGYNLLSAATLWDQVGGHVTDTLIPVVVYSGNKMDAALLTGDIPAIRESLDVWSQSWRDRDINSLMSFYGDSFASYSIDSAEPQVYSLADLRDIRGRILATSSSISLNTSTPVCFTDPLNPELAIAVFRQEYKSDTYRDKGIKVLYLRRDTNQAERTWKIVAKFFLPE